MVPNLLIIKWITVIMLISLILFSISCFFMKKEPLREMKSKFESGIDQNEQDYPPFYMHFFYIGVLFLVFDVEIVLSVPMIQSTMQNSMWMLFWLVFMLIVLIGLILEISTDSVDWKE